MILEEKKNRFGQTLLITETRIGKYQTWQQMTADQRREWNSLSIQDRLRIRNQEHTTRDR